MHCSLCYFLCLLFKRCPIHVDASLRLLIKSGNKSFLLRNDIVEAKSCISILSIIVYQSTFISAHLFIPAVIEHHVE